MAADLPLGNEGALNGTTAVTALAAPAADEQRIVPADGVVVFNADTVAHVFTLQKNKNSTVYILEKTASIAAGATHSFSVRVVLDATDESLELVSDATATTTEPDFNVSAMETS